MQDFHIHPSFSIDAKGSINDFCRAALNAGLSEIAFTTHVDSDPATDDHYVKVGSELIDVRSASWLEEYECQVKSAGDKFADANLRVLFAAEVDYHSRVLEVLPDHFWDTDFDFLIASAHLIDHMAISSQSEAHLIFKRYDLERLVEIYFELLIEAVESNQFDILAHLDLYRRYGEAFYGPSIRSAWKPHVAELTQAMLSHDVGFEINTSTLRRGMNEPMPEYCLAESLVKSGIRKVTLGSDAHRPGDVGHGIREAYRMIQRLNIDGPLSFV